MNPWKAHSAAICLLLSLALLVGVWACIFIRRDAGEYRMEMIEGSAAALDGVLVSLTYEDAVHRRHVRVKNGAVLHTYEAKLPFIVAAEASAAVSAFFEEHERATFTVEEQRLTVPEDTRTPYHHDITLKLDKLRLIAEVQRRHKGEPQYDTAQVRTGIVVDAAEEPFQVSLSRRSASEQEQGAHTVYETKALPEIGAGEALCAWDEAGALYFTPPVYPGYTGESALYRVDAWNTNATWYSYGAPTPTPTPDAHALARDALSGSFWEIGDVTELVSFPIESGMRTLQLGIAGDKLCLLLAKEGKLLLRVYGMDGVLQQELPLGGIDETYLTAGGEPGRTVSVLSCANPAQDGYTLCYCISYSPRMEQTFDETGRYGYVGPADGEEPPNSLLLAVSLGGKDTTFLSRLERDGISPIHLGYVDGKFISVEQGFHYYPSGMGLGIAGLLELRIVSEDGLLYRGNILTGAQEDAMASMPWDDADGTIDTRHEIVNEQMERLPTVVDIQPS